MDSLRAYNHLESAILTGKLKPRERLVEKGLAERLGTSRTAIREVLRRLEERGMVRILPRRGAVVSNLSPLDVENIYAVRIHLEVFGARLAAQRISREGLRRVAELGGRMPNWLVTGTSGCSCRRTTAFTMPSTPRPRTLAWSSSFSNSGGRFT